LLIDFIIQDLNDFILVFSMTQWPNGLMTQ
jgi:hypothetical protein